MSWFDRNPSVFERPVHDHTIVDMAAGDMGLKKYKQRLLLDKLCLSQGLNELLDQPILQPLAETLPSDSYLCKFLPNNQVGGGDVSRKRKQNQPLRPGPAKKPRSDDKLVVEDEEVMHLTKTYYSMIRTAEKWNRSYTRYNFRTRSFTPNKISEKLKEVYAREASYNGRGSIFKVNIRGGLILMDRVTGQLSWFYPGRQTELTDKPIIIQTKKDLDRAVEELSKQDFREKLLHYKPNSRMVFFQPTNLEILVTPVKGLPLRGDLTPSDFPQWLVDNKDVYCFIKSGNGNCLIHDGLCLFRCLAVFFSKHNNQACETEAKRLAKVYCKERGLDFIKFPGVTMAELELVENYFNVGIKVYGESNGEKFLCRVPHGSMKNGICQVLTLQSKHFCLIKPGCEERFLGGFQCGKCTKLETTKWECVRHEAKCKGGVGKVVVKTGEYISKQSLKSLLNNVGVHVKNITDIFQPYFIVFDAESRMEKTGDDLFSSKTEYEYRHEALVVCAATNIPGENAEIFINEQDPQQPDQYLRDFFTQIECWRLTARDENVKRAKYILDDLDMLIRGVTGLSEQFNFKRRLEKLRNNVYRKLETINVLSFNGRSYDIPLMRKHLLPLLHEYDNNLSDEEETDDEEKQKKSGIRFMLKQGASRYDAILGNKIRFLDVLNYLGGQAVSLRGFVSNFAKDQSEKIDKAWFPYKVLKKIETLKDLKQFGIPVVNDFNSDMGDGNTLGKTEDEIQQNYKEFIRLWHENACSNLYEWIMVYVKIDCLCMIPAIENLQKEWYRNDIDVFSDHCTIQSAMTPYLMSTVKNHDFSYFVIPDEDTLMLLREKGMTGGLAEIFTRHQEAGVTPIHPGSDFKTEMIESLDSNSQYLAALGSEMPVGPYLVRECDEGFKPKVSGEKKATSAIQWLDFEAHQSGRDIQHSLNGKEPKLWCGDRTRRPDGLHVDTNGRKTVYEYDGCDVHGCDRPSCKYSKLWEEISERTGKSYKEMRMATQLRNEMWKKIGAQLVIKQHCEFEEEIKRDGELKDFLEHWLIGAQRFGQNTHELSEEIMKEKLKSGEIFGFALVDIECDPNHPDYEKMKMFPPIIRSMNIDPSMIPKEILKMGEENGIIFDEPRKNLVACMTGKQVLIYTPLLKYQCEIGVKLTKVYKVIQFQGKHYPFKNFEKLIAENRREGDKTGNVVKSNLAKHMGASAWGKFAFNPVKRNTFRIMNNDELVKQINKPTYMSHLELGEEYGEVQLRPKTIKYDLPVEIAVAVYGAAKLNLLKFVHSYILKYFDHTKLTICGTDTDSVIVSWAASEPEDLIHPHLRAEYEKEKYNFVVDYRSPEAEAYTKCLPGLFKVENRAKGFIGLSAKCYIMADETGKTIKHAAKGVSSKNNKEILRFETFKAGLYERRPVEATNISFRTIRNKSDIYTTKARRTGLQPFYIKRKLLAPDFIFSEPLDESKENIDI